MKLIFTVTFGLLSAARFGYLPLFFVLAVLSLAGVPSACACIFGRDLDGRSQSSGHCHYPRNGCISETEI